MGQFNRLDRRMMAVKSKLDFLASLSVVEAMTRLSDSFSGQEWQAVAVVAQKTWFALSPEDGNQLPLSQGEQ